MSTTPRRLWQSLEELDGTLVSPPAQSLGLGGGVDRRRFLQLMGASIALAGSGGCFRQPAETVVPQVRGPQNRAPGQPLYFSIPADPSNPTIYRYAPWFAGLWVPLTYLPHALVMALWDALLVGSAMWLVWPNWRSPASVALSLLLLPYVLKVTSTGNVQILMLAAIAYGLTSRWGPIAVGMAASLKGWPLLFAAYWWRRPSRIAFAVGVAALLLLPMLAFDLSAYPPTTGVVVTPAIKNALLVFGRVLAKSPRARETP